MLRLAKGLNRASRVRCLMQLYPVGSRLDQTAKFLGGNDGKHIGSIGEVFIQRRDQL